MGQPREDNFQSQAISKAAYHVVAEVEWPSQVIDEKSAILASLAYAVWRFSWRKGDFADMRLYEARCESHVLEQEHARDFLALPPEGRSEVVNARFLSDSAVLLAAILTVRRLSNVDPSGALRLGREIFDWISEMPTTSSDEGAWLACQAALAIGGSLRFLGEMSEAEGWLDHAEAAARRTSCAELSLQVEYQRLTNMYVRRQLSAVRDRSTKLIEGLARLGLKSDLGKAMFLHACTLKEGGSAAALDAFEQSAYEARSCPVTRYFLVSR